MDGPHHVQAANPFPVRWGVARYASNPVIDVVNNVSETTEQYVPTPIKLGNGDIWVYVKGHVTKIYGWKSTDGGLTFSLQNGGSPVLTVGAGGTWDSQLCLDPCAVYDAGADTIHLYYKGTDDPTLATNVQLGHATAPGTTPATFTKDAANPILTPTAMSTDLGGGTVGNDLAVSSIIKIGSTFHFYGTVIYSSAYRLFHASGSTWNNPSSSSILTTAPGAFPDYCTVVQCPSVFSYGNVYGMLYSYGGPQTGTTGQWRRVRSAVSSDGVTWDFGAGSDVLSPTWVPESGSPVAWDSYQTYAASVLKSSASPYSAPVTDSQGRWFLYYSGWNNVHANSGLAFLSPS